MKLVKIKEARQLLKQGKLIAYPTESVYGLGCDPFNQFAVETLLTLKQREASKGLILLIAEWSQLTPLIGFIPDQRWDAVKKTWPGPVTWIFPKSEIIPQWVSGQHESVAIRMTAHPCARQLCTELPMISTSANKTGVAPAVDVASVKLQFPQGIEAIVEGELGDAVKPSAIFDVLSGRRLR